MKPFLTLAAAIAILVAAPWAIAEEECRDCEEQLVEPVPMTDTDYAPNTKGGEELSLPQIRDRLLETTLVLDAVANVADSRPETREGPADILPGDGISSGDVVLLRPRGSAMLTSRQRAERQIRGVIRRLR